MTNSTLVTQNSIACLLEKVKSIGGTHTEVSEDENIMHTFRKVQAHQATPIKTHYSLETVNGSGATVLRTESEIQ